MKGKHNAHYSYWQLILTVWGSKPNHIITNDYYCYLLYGNAEKPGPSIPGAAQKCNHHHCPWKSRWCWKAVVITSMAITEICVPISECNHWPERKPFYFHYSLPFWYFGEYFYTCDADLGYSVSGYQCCHQELQDWLLEVTSSVPLGR